VHTALTLTVNPPGKPDKVALPLLLVAFGNGAFRDTLPLREMPGTPQAVPVAVKVMTAVNVPVTGTLPPPGQMPELGEVTRNPKVPLLDTSTEGTVRGVPGTWVGVPSTVIVSPTVNCQSCVGVARTSEGEPRHNALTPEATRSMEAVADNDRRFRH